MSITFDYKAAQCRLDTTPSRLPLKGMSTTNPVSFTQSIQDNNVMSVPAHSDVVSPHQAIRTKTPAYPDLYLPDAMN